MSAELIVLRKSVPAVSEETVEELETLLAEAKAGKLTGIAYVAMHQGSEFSINARGRALMIPVYTVGMIRSLESFIQALIA